MRLLLCLGTCLTLSVPSIFPAQAQTPSAAFWDTAQQLTQEQINLLSRVQDAIASNEPNEIVSARAQTLLHVSKVERFLQSLYPIPSSLCRVLSPSTPGDTRIRDSALNQLSPQQLQAYCGLHNSTRQLASLLPILNQVVPASSLLPRNTRSNPLPITPQATLRTPAVATSVPTQASSPNIPGTPAPILGRPAKTTISGYTPAPLPPLVTPPRRPLPPAVASRVQIATQSLNQAQAAFPSGISFVNPRQPQPAPPVVNPLATLQQSPEYVRLLALPNTGVMQVRPQTTASNPEQKPEFSLTVAEGRLLMPTTDLDYGFITPLGDVPLETLTAQLSGRNLNLPATVSEFFLNYRPPNYLETLQIDRRRFMSGKLNDFGLPDQLVSGNVPVVLNQTYLARVIEFEIPEVLRSGTRVTPAERRSLFRLLELPSRDVLVAFRPISQNPDGSYNLLWRILTTFPQPEIADLERYLLP